MRFELQKTQLFRYFQWTNVFSVVPIALMALAFFVLIMTGEGVAMQTLISTIVSILVIAAGTLAFMLWHSRQMVKSLEYEIDDHILYVNEGVFVIQRKAIPLDRVTDIQLVQGMLMRATDIWKIQVQTASHGSMGAEGVLWAINSPKQARTQLIEARKAAVVAQRIESAA